MKNYKDRLLEHLGTYKKQHLGFTKQGEYKRKSYDHILPDPFKHFNFLEEYRSEILEYLIRHPKINLHDGYHHLNSSQTFALNLFFPYFNAGGNQARELSKALGMDDDVLPNWEFEFIPDKKEETNVDIAWKTPNSIQVFCEVKLSEPDFGAGENNPRHQRKLKDIYRPELKSIIPEELLNEEFFFRNYQIFRYVYHLVKDINRQLIIVAPRENEALIWHLTKILGKIEVYIPKRINIIYIEDCLRKLQKSSLLSLELRQYAKKMQEKYVIP